MSVCCLDEMLYIYLGEDFRPNQRDRRNKCLLCQLPLKCPVLSLACISGPFFLSKGKGLHYCCCEQSPYIYKVVKIASTVLYTYTVNTSIKIFQ